MNYLKFLLLTLVTGFTACTHNSEIVTKPLPFEFGSTMAEIEQNMLPLCDSLHKKMDEPIQLPTAKKDQSQLNCFGFMYAGKKRKVELIFADDTLDMVWILTEAEEESMFVENFKELYGEPTHIKEDVTFFLNDGVAVRNNPHEVLFISERIKIPYEQWLNSSN